MQERITNLYIEIHLAAHAFDEHLVLEELGAEFGAALKVADETAMPGPESIVEHVFEKMSAEQAAARLAERTGADEILARSGRTWRRP